MEREMDGPVPHQPQSDTSSLSAQEMHPTRVRVRWDILYQIRDRGALGATSDELSHPRGLTNHPPQTVSGVLVYLSDRGYIRDTGERRRSRWNRLNTVYVAISEDDPEYRAIYHWKKCPTCGHKQKVRIQQPD